MKLVRGTVNFSFCLNGVGTDHAVLEGESGLIYMELDIHKRVCHGIVMNGDG